jgi:hypothetical protein
MSIRGPEHASVTGTAKLVSKWEEDEDLDPSVDPVELDDPEELDDDLLDDEDLLDDDDDPEEY